MSAYPQKPSFPIDLRGGRRLKVNRVGGTALQVDLEDGAFDNAVLAPMGALTLKGNTTGDSATPQDVSLASLAAPGNPLGDNINRRFDRNASNTTPRTGLFHTAWNQAAAGSLLPPAGTVGAAKIQRMNDRVAIGLGCIQSGDFPATTKGPLDAFEAARSDPRGFREGWAQLNVGSEVGGIAVNAYAFTSSMSEPTFNGFQLCMAFCGSVINDNVAVQQLATAAYFVAFRRPGAGVAQGTGTCATEIDIVNEGNSLAISPANVYPAGGFTTALQLNSGALSPFATDASAALSFGFNGAKFLAGLVVGYNAIAGLIIADGKVTGGYGSFARIPVFAGQEWWCNDGTSWVSRIVSRQLTPSNAQEIAFQDDGVVVGGGAGAGRSFQALYVGATTGAWVTAAPAFGSTPATISAGGAANANIALVAKGTGRLVLDRATSIRATAGASLGFLEVETIGGALACIELKARA